MRLLILTQFSCDYPHGPLFEYLKGRIEHLYLIKHPTTDIAASDDSSVLVTHVQGLSGSRRIRSRFSSFHTNLAWSTVISIYWLAKIWKVDVVIGCGNWYALIGILSRMIGLSKCVVYYATDFVPKNRFSNPLLDVFYRSLDRFVLKHVDIIWNISTRMTKARKDFGYAYVTPEYYVPNVCEFFSFDNKLASEDNVSQTRLLFVGALYRHQGLDHVLKAIQSLSNSGTEVQLDIVGAGPEHHALMTLASSLGIQDSVTFHGYLPLERVLKLATRCFGTVAIYDPARCHFSQYGDPAKIRLYLSLGLPVITTAVTALAAEIEDRALGEICSASAAGVAQAIELLLSGRQDKGAIRRRVQDWVQSFSPERVYSEPLEALLHAASQ